MIRAHRVDDVRRAEAAAMQRVAEGALMQHAAAALAAVVAGELTASQRPGRTGVYGARVVLLVGPGSNGGDALHAGARLARRGARVDAVTVADAVHAGGAAALRAAGGSVGAVTGAALDALLDRADVVVDGILGIGGRPGLTGAAELAVRAIPPHVTVVAVDLPSGVGPDDGSVPGAAVRADVTVTFGTAKAALLLPPAAHHVGRLHVVDIGLDPAVLGPAAVARLESGELAAAWPWPDTGDDKYRRGVLGVVAGGSTYTGAAVLATGAAVRAGAGMVRYVGPQAPTDLVRSHWPQVVPGEGRVQAWAVGSGVDPDDGQQRPHVEAALASDLPCLVDAGALEVVQRRDAPTLLTPHAGELARLLSRLEGEECSREQVEAAPLEHARRAAEALGATVLLKGAVTLVVPPGGPQHTTVLAQDDGPAWLASAGSGDVLAGLAGTLLAAGLEPTLAGAVAAAVHGRAGASASHGGPLDAVRLLDELPAAVRELARC
ncbi:MAG TPA: NAD(P)H-hydrate epimerase [Angustibacter sp.]|nr:NAD(P)H-hydrate epimerase [Angustibacter sp.]